MKTDNTTTLKYVPYGVNGVYFVYDGRYTSGKEGTKKQIQAECDRLNKELAINNYRKGNCNDEPHFTTPDDEIIDTITTLTERTQGVWKVIPANYSGKGNAFKGFAFDIVAEVSDKEEVEICNVLPKELNTEDYAGTQPNTWLSKEQAEANAAFICKAVNEYDKLKAINDSLLNALRGIANKINRDTISTDGLDHLQLSHNECQQLKDILETAEHLDHKNEEHFEDELRQEAERYGSAFEESGVAKQSFINGARYALSQKAEQ